MSGAGKGTRGARLSLWPPSFDAAIFDFDGTLADTFGIWREVDVTFCRRHGIAYTDELARELATRGFAGGSEWVRERYGLAQTPQQICDEWNETGGELYRDRVRLRPGAADYLAALRRRGVPLALATTNDRQVLLSMRHVDVHALFDVVVCGAEVARGKDHPDIYLEAARRLGAGARGCVVFEDIEAGLASARRAGMATCAVRSGEPVQDFARLRSMADAALEGWEGLADRA